jgi:hypothetical protein
VLDFGVADNCYLVESPEVNKLRADLIAETKSHAETAGFLQDRKDQLAAIRASLSLLGDGEPVELANLAAKVIAELASNGSNILCPYHKTVNCNGCPGRPYRSTNCNTTRIQAALDAAKGGE